VHDSLRYVCVCVCQRILSTLSSTLAHRAPNPAPLGGSLVDVHRVSQLPLRSRVDVRVG